MFGERGHHRLKFFAEIQFRGHELAQHQQQRSRFQFAVPCERQNLRPRRGDGLDRLGEIPLDGEAKRVQGLANHESEGLDEDVVGFLFSAFLGGQVEKLKYRLRMGRQGVPHLRQAAADGSFRCEVLRSTQSL